MSVFSKMSDQDIECSFDWSAWLSGDEEVNNAAWSVHPRGGLGLAHILGRGAIQSVSVRGGEPGHRYRLTCAIETSTGRTAERAMAIRVVKQDNTRPEAD